MVILAVVVIALILTIIFVSLFVWIKRLAKKRLEFNDKYDEHFGHFEDREGKDDNYDQINYSDIPNTDFSQLNQYEITFNYENIDPEYIVIEQ